MGPEFFECVLGRLILCAQVRALFLMSCQVVRAVIRLGDWKIDRSVLELALSVLLCSHHCLTRELNMSEMCLCQMNAASVCISCIDLALDVSTVISPLGVCGPFDLLTPVCRDLCVS